MKIMVNGELCEDKQAVVSVYDHGFLYGMGLFETLRTYQGQGYLLSEHVQRLAQGCKDIGLEWKLDVSTLEAQISQLLAANQFVDGYIRISVSAGEAALGLPEGPYQSTNTIIYIKPLPPMEATLYHHGKSLQRLKLRRSTPQGEFQLKSFHYMNNILAKQELRSYPWVNQAEGLFLNQKDELAEGIVSNLFFIQGHKVYTPALETGILAGITRAQVLKISSFCNLALEEGFYHWENLLKADEVFITNSIQEIVPITRLFDEEGMELVIGDGIAGPITKKLLHSYRTSTRRLS